MTTVFRVVSRTNMAMQIVAAVTVFIIALITAVDVLGRDLFDIPLLGAPEIIANSIVFIAFLQVSYAVEKRSMLRVTIVDPFIPPSLRRHREAFGYLLGAVLLGLICYSSWDLMIESWATGEYQGEGSLRVPIYPVRTVIVAMSFLASVNYLLMLWRVYFEPTALEPELDPELAAITRD